MRLFDACYKMGIKDAIEVDNEMQCREFCDKMYAPQKFGRIIYDYEYSWREWKYRLTQIIYDDVMFRNQGLKYFDCITNYGAYLACVLPIAMDFYLQGIKDYVKYPNPSNLLKFESKGFVLWSKTPKKASMDDFVRLLTGYCFDRIRVDREAIEAKRARDLERLNDATKGTRGRKPKEYVYEYMPVGLTPSSYENFQREIWRNTRVKSYKTRGR